MCSVGVLGLFTYLEDGVHQTWTCFGLLKTTWVSTFNYKLRVSWKMNQYLRFHRATQLRKCHTEYILSSWLQLTHWYEYHAQLVSPFFIMSKEISWIEVSLLAYYIEGGCYVSSFRCAAAYKKIVKGRILQLSTSKNQKMYWHALYRSIHRSWALIGWIEDSSE